jgi:phosphomannomutase
VYDLYISTLGELRSDLRGLKVIVDSQNGATAGWVARLLSDLGADVLPIRNLHGPLPDDPEPKKERFSDMDILLRAGRYDVGFGYDPDGDRIIVGLKGVGMLTEEQTTALALYAATRYLNVGKVAVLNYSTSTLSEKVLRESGLEVVRYKVGEPNVIQKLEEMGGVIGGEGNGGLIYLPFSKGRDGVLAALLVSRLVKEGNIPERIVNTVPYMGKGKVSAPIEEVLKLFEDLVSGWALDRTDGYYFRKGASWLHVRPSNTEPVVRVIWEGDERFYAEVKARIANMK